MDEGVGNQSAHHKGRNTGGNRAQSCVDSWNKDVEEAENCKFQVDKHEAFPKHLILIDCDPGLELGDVPPELLHHLNDGQKDERIDPALPNIGNIVDESRVFVAHTPESEVISAFVSVVVVTELRVIVRSSKEVILDSMVIAGG